MVMFIKLMLKITVLLVKCCIFVVLGNFNCFYIFPATNLKINNYDEVTINR